MADKPKVIVITGPTATGKSDLAVSLAQKNGGEVISADSRQVYKGLNIGTGKITKKEMKGVPHHLLDVANPRRRFTASDYKMLAEKATQKIIKNKKIPIVCGGTGFYIDTFLGEAQISEVPPNLKLREKLEKKSAEELFSMLKKIDKVRAGNIDPKNKRRVIRAIEICEVLGTVPKLVDSSQQLADRKYEVFKIGIKIPDKELKNRINKRLDKRIRMGMIAEAKNLHKKGLSYKRMRELGLEYKHLADLLEKKVTKEEFVKNLSTDIWHYAKRQMTYFKKNKSIVWLPASPNGKPPSISSVQKEVSKFLK